MITIYGIRNCDTMKKAFTWLDENKIPYTFHDYKTEGISKKKIEEWLKVLPLTEVLNLRSTTYKELSEKDKASITDKNKAIQLLINNTSMIKRPLVEAPKGILLGFKAENWTKELL